MPFDYQVQKQRLRYDGIDIVECIERIGHLLKTTGVFRVGDAIRGDTWNCLLAIELLEKQGFIELASKTGWTQDHIYRKAT